MCGVLFSYGKDTPPMRHRLLALLLAAPLVALAGPAAAVTVDWVAVGNASNAADTPSGNCYGASCGSVATDYRISKYETTNAQYAEFLNAKALSDPHELYSVFMDTDAEYGGITRSGAPGTYSYTVKTGFANKPVTYVTFPDALRFANWLHNGQGSGDTETGAYTITPAGIVNNSITRNEAEATVFLPSENEWYKAAYYDPALPGYYDYPAGTDTPTSCTAPGPTPNTANCNGTLFEDVGSYTGSASPYGTLDQGGNAWEWNEQIGPSSRGIRGGHFGGGTADPLAASFPSQSSPSSESHSLGFRVASRLVPEPAQVLLVLTGGLVLAAARRQRRA